uniref:EF-hand domain-containing protein n=1 Tax=Timema poppense TaxID=170557 RepID=A0A7R9DTP4_TIMPO|nr:unnamed protein product [Timema poppensis]
MVQGLDMNTLHRVMNQFEFIAAYKVYTVWSRSETGSSLSHKDIYHMRQETNHWSKCLHTNKTSAGYLKRAKAEKLHEVFLKFASKEVNGEKFMTAADFVQNYLGLYSDANFNPESVKLLAGIVDTSKDGLISFAEFQAFEGLLCVPDALYKTAFQLFDTNGNGMVAFEEFAEVIRKTVIHQKIPFNLDGTFVQLYFGKEKKRLINYAEFSQFLHDFHEEYAMEAFRRHDKLGTGFISALDFQDIMISIKSHLLTKEVRENLVAVS